MDVFATYALQSVAVYRRATAANLPRTRRSIPTAAPREPWDGLTCASRRWAHRGSLTQEQQYERALEGVARLRWAGDALAESHGGRCRHDAGSNHRRGSRNL